MSKPKEKQNPRVHVHPMRSKSISYPESSGVLVSGWKPRSPRILGKSQSGTQSPRASWSPGDRPLSKKPEDSSRQQLIEEPVDSKSRARDGEIWDITRCPPVYFALKIFTQVQLAVSATRQRTISLI